MGHWHVQLFLHRSFKPSEQLLIILNENFENQKVILPWRLCVAWNVACGVLKNYWNSFRKMQSLYVPCMEPIFAAQHALRRVYVASIHLEQLKWLQILCSILAYFHFHWLIHYWRLSCMHHQKIRHLIKSRKSNILKDSPDPSHVIFEINVGKRRICHRTLFGIDWRNEMAWVWTKLTF